MKVHIYYGSTVCDISIVVKKELKDQKQKKSRIRQSEEAKL
jgi:hypothetical protein